MTHSFYKRFILARLGWINEALGTEYQTDYVSFYGGWNLYIKEKESGAHFHGMLGFDYRRSSKEMLSYLDGIWMGLNYRAR